ncbi:MAG: hypothetical protein EOO02_24885, partial [Chitinophagaceae bacterium]
MKKEDLENQGNIKMNQEQEEIKDTVAETNENEVSEQPAVEEVPVADTSNAEDESPMGGTGSYHSPGNIEVPVVTGPGTVVVNPDGTITYTAPSTVDQDKWSEIQATLKKLKYPTRFYDKTMKLRLKVNIARADFFAGTYDGTPFTCIGANASVSNGVTFIQGAT